MPPAAAALAGGMLRTPAPVPLSVLDLALVGEGQSSGDALRAAGDLAVAAEGLGMARFWLAEHHGMPAVASTSPPVLIAHVAARTARIRVGSGGVMLPNHPPLVVAEQFALLEALHPGRIDLGIGRAPGTDQMTAAALRRSAAGLGAEDFPRQLGELLALLDVDHDGRLRATPAPTSSPTVILLGSSDYSAHLAGRLGVPFAFAHHFAGGGTLPAIAAYRREFRPSAALERPHVIVTASVVVGGDEADAQRLAGPSRLMMLALRSGRLRPLHTPEAAAADPQLELARSLPTTQLVGTAEGVAADLAALVEATGADELMLTVPTHGLDDRIRTLERLAAAWERVPARA
jgi:luciferase family oxidoreductase group 1